MKRLLVIIITVIMLAGCAQKPKPVEQPESVPVTPTQAVEQNVEAIAPPAKEEEASNIFDARKVKPGDQISGMKVIKVEVHNASDEDYDAYVNFEGEVTISGVFKHNLNDEFMDHEISFMVDDKSAELLPKLAHDQRIVWFMFMNHDEAEKAFGSPGTEGEATVTIKNYSINYAHTEIWNTADFIDANMK